MSSPRIRGKKTVNEFCTKFKKDEGIKDFYEDNTSKAESTLKMMIRQAHEIHKGFYRR